MSGGCQAAIDGDIDADGRWALGLSSNSDSEEEHLATIASASDSEEEDDEEQNLLPPPPAPAPAPAPAQGRRRGITLELDTAGLELEESLDHQHDLPAQTPSAQDLKAAASFLSTTEAPEPAEPPPPALMAPPRPPGAPMEGPISQVQTELARVPCCQSVAKLDRMSPSLTICVMCRADDSEPSTRTPRLIQPRSRGGRGGQVPSHRGRAACGGGTTAGTKRGGRSGEHLHDGAAAAASGG